MLKAYCSNCGSPTEYSLAKPKFCTNCGFSFINNTPVANKSIQVQHPVKAKRIINEDHDEYEDENVEVEEIKELPNIENLDFDITISPSNIEKIGDLAGTSKENLLRRQEDNTASQADEKFLENFAKEAGAIRPKNRVRKLKNGE